MNTGKTIAEVTSAAAVSAEQVRQTVAQTCSPEAYKGQRVLMIIPDGTRTSPVGLLFKSVFEQIGAQARSVDILVALGTHQPMSEEAICGRLEISPAERRSTYAKVQFYNHEWNNPAALQNIGTIPAQDISELSGGLFSMDVPVDRKSVV